ncbi:MAG: hypothetical protein ACO3RX_03885 [Chthoniobacterales bacterium]|jgi:hypothetical protein
MSLGGWIVMLLSVGGTTVFFFWCINRVLRPPDKTEKMHGVLDTELEIEEEERRRRRGQKGG